MNWIKILNILNPFLYLRRYYIKRDPFKDFSHLIQGDQSKHDQEENKGNILVVPFRVSPESNLFEGLISQKFLAEGYSVHGLFCGQGVKYCDHIGSFVCRIFHCNLCRFEQSRFKKSFRIKGHDMDTLVDQNRIKDIHKNISEINLEKLKEYRFLNVPVYEVLYQAMQRHLLEASPDLEKNKKIVKGFLYTILKTISAFDQLTKRIKPKLVLLSHGIYASWGAVLAYCKIHKLDCVVWGRVYNNAGILASHNETYLIEPLFEPAEKWQASDLSDYQFDLINNYFRTRIGLTPGNIVFDYNRNQKQVLSKGSVRELLHLPEKGGLVGLFPNIPWDGQILNKSEAFPDFESWLVKTTDFFVEKKEVTLVIRSHPAELLRTNASKNERIETLIHKHFKKLPQNIMLLPPDHKINSYSLALASEVALVYGTTLGIELAYLKVPVIVAGNIFYKNKGITFDANKEEEYFSLIEKGMAGELLMDENQWQNALKLGFHFNFRRVMPETVVELKDLRFLEYKIKSIQDLLTNPEIENFFKCCVDKGPFYFDEFY